MNAFYMSGGAYAFLTAHQSGAHFFSSLISIIGLIAVYVLLCLVNFSNGEKESNTVYYTERTQARIVTFVNLLISFGLGLLVLIAVTLLCCPRRPDAEEQLSERKRHSEKFWLLSLGLMLKRYHVKLTEEDAVDCDQRQNRKRKCLLKKSWKVPKAGVPNDDNEKFDSAWRLVSEKCAICLESYSTGDKVAYSSNPNCPHAYHEQCILSWMLPSSTNKECPCCRQIFLNMYDSLGLSK